MMKISNEEVLEKFSSWEKIQWSRKNTDVVAQHENGFYLTDHDFFFFFFDRKNDSQMKDGKVLLDTEMLYEESQRKHG